MEYIQGCIQFNVATPNLNIQSSTKDSLSQLTLTLPKSVLNLFIKSKIPSEIQLRFNEAKKSY